MNVRISFNWNVDLLFLVCHPHVFDRKQDFEVFIKYIYLYIYMVFGVECGPNVCDWSGLHPTPLRPYLHHAIHFCLWLPNFWKYQYAILIFVKFGHPWSTALTVEISDDPWSTRGTILAFRWTDWVKSLKTIKVCCVFAESRTMNLQNWSLESYG
jgi:hypothetical protein